MSEHFSKVERIWGDAVRDGALAGLKVEMDGLAAMFSVLTASGLLPARGPKGGPAQEAEDLADDDLEFDNLPI